jgi:hypothetical protein
VAANPEAGLFPGLMEAAFIPAPEVEDLAADVLARWDEFAPIRHAIADGELEITYVFETKHFDQFKEEFKPHTIAKVTKASPLWSSLTGHDLVIQFRRTFWAAFDEHQRSAVLYHEFCHVKLEDSETGGPKLSLAPHDVEEFRGTLLRYGPTLPGRKQLIAAAAAWQAENEPPALTPKQIHQVMETVFDQVNAGALGPDVTASMAGQELAIGDAVVTTDQVEDIAAGTKLRVRELTTIGTVSVALLAVAGPSWRRGPIVARTDPSQLEWDRVPAVWRGPTWAVPS